MKKCFSFKDPQPEAKYLAPIGAARRVQIH